MDELFHIGRRMRRIALQSAVGGMALSVAGMMAAFVGLLVWVRLVKPRRALARPWRLERVVAEPGEITTLALKPPAKFWF